MEELSLYIHIPFCVKKCDYCDFLSYGVGELCMDGMGHLRRAYLDSLCNEIKSYAHLCKNNIIKTIFIGGGTPSILLSGDISKVIKTVRAYYKVATNAEITIESNPGTLTSAKLAEYRDCGINRLSIGLQSSHDEELAMLGRIHNYDQFLASFNMAREQGFRNINVDIMAGLPGQTIHSYLKTIENVLKLKPEHISSYGLIVEEGTAFADNEELLSALPGEEAERSMYDATKKILELSGYKRYEISNYAKVGYECQHNMVYWTLGKYIGLGIGAASFFAGRRYTNTSDINQYIDTYKDKFYENLFEETEIINVDEEVNAERLMEEFMFLGLRMSKGVSAADFFDYFGRSIYEIYGDVIDKYAKSGHINDDGGIICLTKKGVDVSNQILADFLLEA